MMTQLEREQFIMGQMDTCSPEDWLQLISAWKNEDGSITIIANAPLRTGSKFRLFPKREGAPERAPDFQCSVQRKKVAIEDGVVETLV